ncbi:hypothetical protein VV869_10530 [Photobacterium sp. MCCC 1A19761]|uniref:hypothetical protein n=1 Tax=Photobacterium sp. MCCC 1A19761 TaxID=3115000 RepID=UPI00307DE15D
MMRQTWGLMLLLFAGSLHPAVAAQEVSQQQLAQVAASARVQDRVTALTKLYNRSDFRALEFNLSQLPLLQQEAVRGQLVAHAMAHGALDQAKADWLQAQAERKQAFTVVEQGDGYQITQSAFHYPAQARGLVRQWQETQLGQQMVAQAEVGELVLSRWLAGDLHTQQTRRDLFLQHLPQLSAQAVANLVAQFAADSQLMWLPDNGVIAHLAAVSGDPGMYHLLWRRRTDRYSQAELNRLASQAPEPTAVTQLMAATMNPSLKPLAYKALITLKPLPAEARAFLTQKLDEVDDGHLVASELARHGYRQWLAQLAEDSRNPLRKKHLQAALALEP